MNKRKLYLVSNVFVNFSCPPLNTEFFSPVAFYLVKRNKYIKYIAYINTHIHIYPYISIYTYTHIYIYIYIYIYIIYIYIYIYLYKHPHINICLHTYFHG